MQFEQIAIVGVGLIGGSVGLAARARGVARRVVGIGRDAAALTAAQHLGAIDEFATDIAAGVRACSLIVVCTPVDRIAEHALAAAVACPPGTLITDAGSTKAAIVRTLDAALPPSVRFVGAHPLAGSEKKGPQHASAELFRDRVTVVTPSAATDAAAGRAVAQFWAALGSRIVSMSPEAHDAALAITSHLPHAVAAALAGVTPIDLLELAAGGYRDTTRIAAGDPALWAAIFRANRDAVLGALAQYSARLADFQRRLDDDDAAALVRWLSEAKQVRDALGT